MWRCWSYSQSVLWRVVSHPPVRRHRHLRVAASPQVLLDLHGSGTKTTEKFTAAADWDLQWSYDCTAGLGQNGVIPSGYHCSFIVHIVQPDGHASLENQGVNQLGVKDQSVEHYHAGGTFYLQVQVCCSDNSWTVQVIG
jgi:hypothetical protein